MAADLHMEHLNRTVKGALGYHFSNLHSDSILRTEKICGLLNSVCSVFDKETSLVKKSTRHSSPRFESDLDKVIQQLMKIDAFKTKPGRFHSHFKTLNSPLTSNLHMQKDALIKWMHEHFKNIIL